MIARAILVALLFPAGSAFAEVPLLTFDFPAESLAVPQGEPVAAKATRDQNGQVAVFAQLGGTASKSFAEITERQVGQKITVSLCGDKLMEAMLQTPMLSGSLIILGPPMAEAADRIVARLTAGLCDPD